MFVLMFYDVGEKRVNKVLKVARRYLTWIQNSVLEGDLSPATFEALKVGVKKWKCWALHEVRQTLWFSILTPRTLTIK